MAHKSTALVLDTWTIIAYLQDEPAAGTIVDIIVSAQELGIPMYMSVVNVCEVWYILARELSDKEADFGVNSLRQLGIRYQDVNWQVAQEAARIKAKGKMSLGDSFAAALAKDLGADLVTGDSEFKQIEGQIKVIWLSK